MAELLQLPILVASASAPPPPTSAQQSSTSAIYPAFPPRQPPSSATAVDELPLNVGTLHVKLTKAEFVGCLVRGEPLHALPITWLSLTVPCVQSNAPRTLPSSACKALCCRRLRARSRLSRRSPRSKVRRTLERQHHRISHSRTTHSAVLPKEGSIFTLDLPLKPSSATNPSIRVLSFDIYGDAFAFRSADRVGRKWKAGTSAGGVELM